MIEATRDRLWDLQEALSDRQNDIILQTRMLEQKIEDLKNKQMILCFATTRACAALWPRDVDGITTDEINKCRRRHARKERRRAGK